MVKQVVDDGKTGEEREPKRERGEPREVREVSSTRMARKEEAMIMAESVEEREQFR